MADIELLKKKLQGLSDKIKTKDALGKDYKKIVSDSLARIKAKITKILADHNKQVQDITKGSAENLDKTRAELAAQQARLKQASDAALEAAKRNQDKLQNNLDDTNKQLNNLQSELNKPNPDTQNMQVIIEKLRQDLQSAQNDSAAANAQIAQLTERLIAYDGVREKMDELVKNLLAKIGDILAQVDAMSINQGDITELLRLLNETEDMFPKDDGSSSGNDDGGGIFGNLFGGPSGAGAGGPSTIYAAPQGNSAGSGLPAARIPRGANTAPGQSAPVIVPGTRGGKTKRRRGKKTMYRGGYVEKLRAKKTRKRPRTSKRRKSSSSSSSSSNSR
jgi:hypothetical protein